MKVLTLVYSFVALGSATPAPRSASWQGKRQAADAPAYAAHTINQPVRWCAFVDYCALADLCARLIISRIAIAMFLTPMPPSSSGTVSTNLLRAYSAYTKYLI